MRLTSFDTAQRPVLPLLQRDAVTTVVSAVLAGSGWLYGVWTLEGAGRASVN